MIIPFPYAWIASLVVGFSPWISTLRVIFRLLCLFTIFCVLATHMFCKVAASPPRRVFAHKRTVRLIIENDMRIDSLQVIASLQNFQADITCVVPRFGAKCIDITLRDHKVTTRLAASGFDYGHSKNSCAFSAKERSTSLGLFRLNSEKTWSSTF